MQKKRTKGGGRPPVEINIEQLKSLCKLHCTGEEIAGFFEIDYDTLVVKIKELDFNSFSECFNRFSAHGKINLRRKQYEVALAGNPIMLCKLGDKWLRHDIKEEDIKDYNLHITIEVKEHENLSHLTDEDIRELRRKGHL